MIDREQVREALKLYRNEAFVVLSVSPELLTIVEAAEAWLDQGDALVIRKVDGEWPWWTLDAWAKVGGSATHLIATLDALADAQPSLSVKEGS